MGHVTSFDKLWNYNDPAGTEAKFRGLLPTLSDPAERVELLTQIARAMGLQGKFDQAHATLDEAEKMLAPAMGRARVRYLLERGRVFNSSGLAEKAIPIFEQAWKLGEAEELPRFAIDAVHMIAIALRDPREKVQWNLRGIAMVEAEPAQRRWLSALYNNLGEAYASLKDYANALDAFIKLSRLDIEQRGEADPYTLKDQSRMLRALGRSDEAMAITRPIYDRLTREGKSDGWISAEYAECLLACGDAKTARQHFAAALASLREDAWVRANDPAMLERLEKLSR